MKSMIKTATFTGIPFGIAMGLWFYYQSGNLIAASWSGLFCVVFFGIGMAVFVQKQKGKFQAERPLLKEERLVKEGGVNHFLNGESVGGWIYLTDRRVYFKSHSVNLQNHELSIPLEDIEEVATSLTFYLVPNGLRIKTIDGKTQRFVVQGRKAWLTAILEAKQALK